MNLSSTIKYKPLKIDTNLQLNSNQNNVFSSKNLYESLKTISMQITDRTSLKSADLISLKGSDFLLEKQTGDIFSKRCLLLTSRPFISMKQKWAMESKEFMTDRLKNYISIKDIDPKTLPSNDPTKIPSESLAPTYYCNFITENGHYYGRTEQDKSDAISVSSLAKFISDKYKLDTDTQKIESIFEYVKELEYNLGLFGKKTACDTLKEGSGTCSNKSVALIALLRSLKIPSLPVLYSVKTPDYLGNGETLNPMMGFWTGEKSAHVSVITYNRDINQWIHIDPSDNTSLSSGSGGVITTLPISTDGKSHAFLYIKKEHINSIKVISSLDEILDKGGVPLKDDVPVNRLLMSLYVKYGMNQQGQDSDHVIPENSEDRFEHFLKWMRTESPLKEEQREAVMEKYGDYFSRQMKDPISRKRYELVSSSYEKTLHDDIEFQKKTRAFFKKMRNSLGAAVLNPEKYLENCRNVKVAKL